MPAAHSPRNLGFLASHERPESYKDILIDGETRSRVGWHCTICFSSLRPYLSQNHEDETGPRSTRNRWQPAFWSSPDPYNRDSPAYPPQLSNDARRRIKTGDVNKNRD